MSDVAGLGVDERRARVALSLLAEPDDPVTDGLLQGLMQEQVTDSVSCSGR